MEQLKTERSRLLEMIEKIQQDEDNDMKNVIRKLREKKQYFDRLIELREIVEKKTTDVDDFKSESLEEYNQMKVLDNSIDKKTIKQLRLMKKVLKKDYLKDEDKAIIFNEITDE